MKRVKGGGNSEESLSTGSAKICQIESSRNSKELPIARSGDLVELKQVDGSEFMAEREIKEEPEDEPLASLPIAPSSDLIEFKQIDGIEFMAEREVKEEPKDEPLAIDPDEDSFPTFGLNTIGCEESSGDKESMENEEPEASTASFREQLNPSHTENGENIGALHVSSGSTVTIDGITVPTGITRIIEGLRNGEISRSLAKPFHGTRDELRKKLATIFSSLHCYRNIDAQVEGIILVGVDKMIYKKASALVKRRYRVKISTLWTYVKAAQIFINFDESEITPERSGQNSREVSADNLSMEYLEPLPRPPEEKMNEEWEVKKEIKEEVKEELTE